MMVSSLALIRFAGLVLALATLSTVTDARLMSKQAVSAKQHAALERIKTRAHARAAADVQAVPVKPPRPPVKSSRLTFSNPKAAQYLVNGKTIPEVDWDVGDSWAGLMPISADPKETRKLFFWFFPPAPQGSSNDLIFWTNGGPGCSSLEGLLQENSPISWMFGQAKPTPNPWSWTNLSSVLWVEQPVGVGFSQGVPNIKNEIDLSKQLVGFFQQFLEVFDELKGANLYLTGESYAGMYLPYLANYIFDNPTALNLDLQGIWLGNPALSWDVIMTEMPTLGFVQRYQSVFGFDDAFMAKLSAVSDKCGYTSYSSKHVNYPPTAGALPLPGKDVEFDNGCDIWDMAIDQALLLNPAFNIYRIFDVYPVLWDVLGEPGTSPQIQAPIYFDRTDVKKAIHAPTSVTWTECAGGSTVFPDGPDGSPNSAFDALPRAIERSPKGVVIMQGTADFVIMAEGQRAIIQNMTWGNAQGFRNSLTENSFIVDSVGADAPVGNVHSERGLTYYEVNLSGHMVPQFSPWSAFQGMQYLMGLRKNP